MRYRFYDFSGILGALDLDVESSLGDPLDEFWEELVALYDGNSSLLEGSAAEAGVKATIDGLLAAGHTEEVRGPG